MSRPGGHWDRQRSPGGGGVIRTPPAEALAPHRLRRYAHIQISALNPPQGFRPLSPHPQLASPRLWKDVTDIDLNYYRAIWHRGHFPVAAIVRFKAARYGVPAAFEASAYYYLS
jgi:hypothetical protein